MVPVCVAGGAYAAPSLTGQEGYINMPSALTGQDGAWSLGYSFDRPYSSVWTSVTVLPALQVTGRYVAVMGIPGFSNQGPGAAYGRYKDKVFDAKLQLLPESDYFPAVALGKTDLFGTELFKGQYVALSKRFDGLETTVGYGSGRISGPFAGARWSPAAFPSWSVVAEYDANDYRNDFNSDKTFASRRQQGLKAGLEYRWGWLSMQVAKQRSHNSINAMLNIPTNEREFIPKIYEPAYYAPTELPVRPGASEWQANPAYARNLVRALEKQDYKLVSARYERGTLALSLTNSRISNLGRAVGRAARTALYFMPLETRTLMVTYTERDMPVATYEFFNLHRLQDYLNGKSNRDASNQFVLVRPASGDDVAVPAKSADDGLMAGLQDDPELNVLLSEDGDIVQLKQQDSQLNRFKIAPKLGFFFNDPSGALHYDLSALANFDRRLGSGLYFNSALGATIVEDVSDVSQPSNSLLPHVRSDVAEYKRGGRFKLFRALLNQYFKPASEWYGRVSGGIYEEMFAGAGGQVLYAPSGKRWAVDLSVDALRQRDFKGWFGSLDYKTVTALAAVHYRLPYGVTGTVRAGRFLARDNGARLEFKRRFRSGIEVGAWYTRTDGKDITNPGKPEAPYHDRGIFFSIPLNSMLAVDSRSTAGFSLSPWTRDVGQMVASPGDLYDIVESPRRDMDLFDGLGNFAERQDELSHPANTLPIERFSPWPSMRLRLDDSSSAFPEMSPLLKGSALAAGAFGLASFSDKRWDRFTKDRQDNRLLDAWGKAGKVAPWIGVGLAGTAMAFGDDRLQNTGFIALQSAAVAGGGSLLLKQAVNRARPESEQGHWARQDGSASKSDSSFPSNHSAMAFALATPFASEYDAPWLYGVAGLASLGRTADRKHWLSDTVGGGLIGYAAGKWLWTAQRRDPRYQAMFSVGQDRVGVNVSAQY
ncbi:YjbH domain-containing protein [Crenobacter cavernae]|nr:YjbH domain-containing protein [Crenobacter cavernae]